MENIKIIFLDWHKTICTDVFWQHLNKGDTKEYFDKIRKNLFIENMLLPYKWVLGFVDTNYVVNKIHEDTKINKDFLIDNLIESSNNMNFVDLEIPNIIKKIRKNNIKVVLSSANMDIFNYTIKSLKLNELFDDLLLSNNLMCSKNDIDCDNKSLFFDDYIKNNNYDYKDCVLIDDSKSLVDVCNILGMNNIRIKNCKEEIKNTLNNFC